MSTSTQELTSTLFTPTALAEERSAIVTGAVQHVGELIRSPAPQPYIYPGHELEVRDIRAEYPDVATHLVIHRYLRRNQPGQQQNEYEEIFTFDARTAVLAGYFVVNLTEYKSQREKLNILGIKSIEADLSEAEIDELDALKFACKAAKEDRDRNKVPLSEVSDAEQVDRTIAAKRILSTALGELCTSNRADFSRAVLTHH